MHPDTPNAPPSDPRTVLVVGDDAMARSLYERMLGARGYESIGCAEPKEAAAILAAHRPDLVLVDLNVNRNGGIEYLRELRMDPHHYDLPVLMVAPLNNEEALAAGISLGADDYVARPVQPGELIARVGMVLRRRQLGKLTTDEFTYGGLFAGRYEITGTLGSGGYGTVYLALDRRQAKPVQVALKAFHARRVKKDTFVPRFLREAYAHSRLHHPNIVELLDFGQVNGNYYLVMEYLDGVNLSEIIEDGGHLDEERAIGIAYEIAKALDYLHLQHAVHRDIKPRNIMVLRAGGAKLLDFGLARQLSDATLSREEFVGGTPEFVSPEYLESSSRLDIRADIYSLGMTLYFALSYRLPFADGAPMELAQRHLAEERAPIATYRPDLRPEFCQLLDDMVRRDRYQRPTSASLLKRLAAMPVPPVRP